MIISDLDHLKTISEAPIGGGSSPPPPYSYNPYPIWSWGPPEPYSFKKYYLSTNGGYEHGFSLWSFAGETHEGTYVAMASVSAFDPPEPR